MPNKNKSNVSETFGKYSQSTFKSNGKKTPEPKNITSDMWTPISTGETAAKELEKKASAKKTTAKPKTEAKEASLISEGRKPSQKKGKKEKNTSKKKQKSRTPKGKPISEINAANADTRASKKQKEADKRRHQQQLSKAERDYNERIKEGKSPSELSKERAALKRKKRIRRNVLTFALFLIFVLAFVGIYTYSKGAPAAVITVEGESVYTSEEIIAAAELEVGVNMFSLREKNINALVTKALPYIHSVEIDRKLPDKLVLNITPTAEKYLIVNSDKYICVDSFDKVISDKKIKLDTGKFRVYGLENQSAEIGSAFVPSEENKGKYELVKSLVAAMENEGVITKAVISVTDRENVKVLYDGKIMIYLGDCSDLEKRIALACKVIETPEVEGKTGYIDMRFGDAAYFREGSTDID